MHYAVGVNAGYDVNGNSRRGWYVYASNGVLRGFLQAEGYGDGILYRTFPEDVITLCRLKVGAGEWRETMSVRQVSTRYPNFDYGWGTDPEGKRYAWSYHLTRDVGAIYYGGQYVEITVSGTWHPGDTEWDSFEVLNTYNGKTGEHMLAFDPGALTEYFIKSGHAG